MARTRPFNQRLECRLFRRAVHHGQLGAQGNLLRGDFKAAQVRGQEQNALATVKHGLDGIPVFIGGQARHPLRRRAPDKRQLDDGLARFGHSGMQVLAEPGALDVAAQATPIRWRCQVDKPTQRAAQ